jgi:uncharacterized protein YjiS (DUF1127 family)
MSARTVTDSYRHVLMLPHADLLAAALASIHALAESIRWAIWRWYEVRRTSKQLSALSDHMLNDIGLSRSDLIAATLRRVLEEEVIRRGGYRRGPEVSRILKDQRLLALDLGLVQVHVEAGRLGRA